MREHIRKLVDEATRRSGAERAGSGGDPALLGAEAVRLARLAASMHMALAARMLAEADDAGRGDA